MATTAVVLGRNYTSRLGMIRAAGMAGCDVKVIRTVNAANREEFDRYSKYVSGYASVPEKQEEKLLRQLLQLGMDTEGTLVLLPTDDLSALFIDTHQAHLKERFLFPHAGQPGALLQFMDKAFQKRLAEEAGLTVPRGWSAECVSGAYQMPEGITFPVFVKPETSAAGSKMIMKRCDSAEALQRHLRAVEARLRERGEQGGTLLMEQFITIEKEYDLPGLALGDQVFLPAVIEKGLMHRGVTGTGTLRDPADFAEAVAALRRMIGGLGFTGLVDVEMYESGGKLYFNELNLRFGASGYGMTGGGVNLPARLIAELTGEAPQPMGTPAFGKTFASEKVCFQEFTSGAVSWKQFRQLTEGADFRFLQSAEDPGPWREFMRQTRKRRFKRRLINLLQGKADKRQGRRGDGSSCRNVSGDRRTVPVSSGSSSPFTILERPESVTPEQLHQLLWQANEANREAGFVLRTSELSGEQLLQRLGPDGKCFVALEGDRLVGTISVRFLTRRAWYAQGLVADYMLAAVLPQDQGRGINSLLAQKVFEAARDMGCRVIELDTAAQNKHALAVYRHQGFVPVGYKANRGGDHYSVIMALWPDGCPYSKWYCALRYQAKRLYIRLRFTPDKKKRF